METTGDRGAPVFLGVDTHSEAHVAVALDAAGRRLGELAVTNDRTGYARLWDWVPGFGVVAAAGVEGTGSYGAGLSRFLRAPGGRTCWRSTARAVGIVVGTASTTPQTPRPPPARSWPAPLRGSPRAQTGPRSRCAPSGSRRSAVKARTQATNQLHALLSTAPDRLREDLRGLPTKRLAEKASRLRCGAEPTDPAAATGYALRSVARRHRALSEEISELNAHIERLARKAAPEPSALDGVGPDTAATLLIAAGDNPDRLRSSEASFAHLLCGTAPVPASSGKTVRHRLDPGGNRNANRAWRSTAFGATPEHRSTSSGAPPRASPRRRP